LFADAGKKLADYAQLIELDPYYNVRFEDGTVFYGANGVMPIALCLRHGLWWAGIFGALAMGLPFLLSNRAKQVAPTVILGG
jgi:hypothetical protein